VQAKTNLIAEQTPGAANVITADETLSSSKSKKTKAKKTSQKSTGKKSTGKKSTLGAKTAEASSDRFPSSHHFSEAVSTEGALSPKGRWRIIIWFLMIGSFISLGIFRFLLWRKDRYGYG